MRRRGQRDRAGTVAWIIVSLILIVLFIFACATGFMRFVFNII